MYDGVLMVASPEIKPNTTKVLMISTVIQQCDIKHSVTCPKSGHRDAVLENPFCHTGGIMKCPEKHVKDIFFT